MKAVNLLPANRRYREASLRRPRPRRKKLLIACGVLGALIVVGLSVMVWSSSSSIGARRSSFEALQSQIASTATELEPSPTDPSAPREDDRHGDRRDRLDWDHFLGTLSKVMPEDVWLAEPPGPRPPEPRRRSHSRPGSGSRSRSGGVGHDHQHRHAPPPRRRSARPRRASTFTITGYTYSQPSVARLMRRLDIVPWLPDVSLVSSSKTAIGPTPSSSSPSRPPSSRPQGRR